MSSNQGARPEGSAFDKFVAKLPADYFRSESEKDIARVAFAAGVTAGAFGVVAGTAREREGRAEGEEPVKLSEHECRLPEADEERQTWNCPVCGRHWYVHLERGNLYNQDGTEFRPEPEIPVHLKHIPYDR